MGLLRGSLCVLALLALLTQPGEGRCEENGEPHGGRCYFFFSGCADWRLARHFCLQLTSAESSLVQDSSPDVTRFLERRLREKPLTCTPPDVYWLGLRGKGGNFSTWSDGTPRDEGYSRWKEGEPSLSRGQQLCVQADREGWSTAPCSERLLTVCQTADPDYRGGMLLQDLPLGRGDVISILVLLGCVGLAMVGSGLFVLAVRRLHRRYYKA